MKTSYLLLHFTNSKTPDRIHSYISKNQLHTLINASYIYRFGLINGCGLGIGSMSILHLLNEELPMECLGGINNPFNIAFGITQRQE